MEIALNIFISALAYTAALWVLIRWFGGTDELNSVPKAAIWGFMIACVSTFGGAALVPLPSLFVFAVLIYYYQLGIGRSLGIIVCLTILAYGAHYGLRPFIGIFFGHTTIFN